MRLRAPPHVCGPISLRGRIIDLAPDGSLDVADAEAASLAAHGFVPLVDAQAAPDVDVATMSRIELFAFLRTHGAPAWPPIRNAELRARALALLSSAAPQ